MTAVVMRGAPPIAGGRIGADLQALPRGRPVAREASMMSAHLGRPVFLVLLFAFLWGCAEELADGPALKRDGSEEAQGAGTTLPVDAPPEAPASAPAPAPEAQTKQVLDVKWYGQETGYWCGPGSTRMALGTRLAEPPSQTELARTMGTTTNGTDHIGLPAAALNKYLGVDTYRSRTMADPPTREERAQLKRDLLARIGGGFPIVANVVSGWRPPGYPGGTIYHYVAVVGFDEGGEKVLVADPAAEGKGGARWEAVPRTYWVSLEDLGTWIGGKGYTG